jgi:tRNA nucleotidyltransferase (CCA-adding enzyme)
MNSTQLPRAIQKNVEELLNKTPEIMAVVRAIAAKGGRALLVGGAVRDLLLHRETKDLDIEIYGLSEDDVIALFKTFGRVDEVGKQFGVLRIAHLPVDWSLPRSDSAGRKPHVAIDPHMPYEKSFARRDVTINAMGIDLTSFALIDPFNGQYDLQHKILRAPDIRFFVEDPLRLFRVMQFIGRFAMQPDHALNEACCTMDISAVSRERIEAEFEKLLLKSTHPSQGIRWLRAIGRLPEILPELAQTIGIKQRPDYHPEEDVFEHSMQALDASARISYPAVLQTLTLRYAALCHDLGKPETTCIVDGVIKTPGHAHVGAEKAKRMLKRITHNHELIDGVAKLVHYHMDPREFVRGNARPSTYKRLARKLSPHVNIRMLADLFLCDLQGRNAASHEPFDNEPPQVAQFREKAMQASVIEKPEEPILLGRDVLDVGEPGPQMGKLLDKAYEIQIEEGITDKEALRKRVVGR